MLEVKNLTVHYGERCVLNNINIKANEGEILGIIGPNGSGKTTLLKAIAKYLKPSSGIIMVDGNDIKKMSGKEIAKRVGVVSQVISINFDFTVKDVVLMGRTPYIRGGESEKDLEIIDCAMKKTNTFHLRNRLVTQLSGGELQRVIIARALAQNPKILLLDEPTSHLDITNQIDILNLVKDTARKGMLVIAVIHDLNLAAYYCDKICLLQDAELLALGTPQEVLTSSNIKRAFNINVKIINNEITNSLSVVPLLEPLHETLC